MTDFENVINQKFLGNVSFCVSTKTFIVLKHEKKRPITGKIYAFVIVTLRKSLQSASDAYSLLRTPRLAKETLSTRTIEVNTKTPQSILKVQKNCYVANKSAICNISYLIPKH